MPKSRSLSKTRHVQQYSCILTVYLYKFNDIISQRSDTYKWFLKTNLGHSYVNCKTISSPRLYVLPWTLIQNMQNACCFICLPRQECRQTDSYFRSANIYNFHHVKMSHEFRWEEKMDYVKFWCNLLSAVKWIDT